MVLATVRANSAEYYPTGLAVAVILPARADSILTPSRFSAIAMSGRLSLVRDSVLLIWQTVLINVGVVGRRVKAMIPNI